MRINDFMVETFKNVSMNGVLYSLNSDEKRLYTQLKDNQKLFKKDLPEYDIRVMNNLVTRGIVKRRKTPQHDIYYTARGRRKEAFARPDKKVCPPDTEMKQWIADNEAKYQEKYGKDYESKLYAKAWNKFNGKKLEEGYVHRMAKYGNTNITYNDDYIEFEKGMRFIDENNVGWTVDGISWTKTHEPKYYAHLTSDNGETRYDSFDDLNLDIFQLEKLRPVYDERFYSKEDL